MADCFGIYVCMAGSANNEVAARLLEQAGMAFSSFDELGDLVASARRDGLGALFLEEERLRHGYEDMVCFLDDQPDWSEIPIILVCGKLNAAASHAFIERLPGITLLERPVSQASLLSHLRAALLARQRQYLVRDLLAELTSLNRDLEQRVSRRTAEAERRRQEAERSNEDLQQFASVISHDLREPLLAIANYLDLIDKRAGEKLGDTGKHFLDRALSNARAMQDMTKALLLYSRSGSGTLNLEKVDSGEIVDQVCANLEVSINNAGAVVTHDDNMPTVYADRVQLSQLFQNLIGNAVKFSSTEAARVHVSADKINGEHRFGVSDNGIGISFEQYQKIFQIYNRVASQNTYPGSGVGLAICKKAVERHGGSIWVESEPGKGSTFYFSLPDETTAGASRQST